MSLIAELIEAIEKKASEESRSDNNSDFECEVNDYAGGNIDDAYSIGKDEGEISFARELKAIIEANT